MPNVPVRILSNLDFPPVEGFDIRCFRNPLALPGFGDGWKPRDERRTLAEIIAPMPASERPDMVVCSSPEYLPIPRDLAAFKGIKVLLITDWNVCLRYLPALCGMFDFCFIDWTGYRLLRGAGLTNVFHQPLFGHDPRVFRDLGRPRDLDLSFCGNQNSAFHPERNRLLHQVALWGAGRQVSLRQAFGDAYVEVLNRSRMVFNYAIRGEANMRLFETMACGAVPLVEEGNREVSILLREGVHYLAYPKQGLKERLTALLAEPQRLAEVAAAAKAEAPRHAKAAQLRSAFSFAAGLEPAFSGEGARAAVRAAAPGADRAGLKAIDSLRILGCNQALDGALRDYGEASADFPELASEALPALLMSGVETRPESYQGAIQAAIDRGASDPALPPAVRSLARMRLAALRGNAVEVVVEGERCLRDFADPSGFPADSDSPYSILYFPCEIGRGLNNDLNRAYRSDLGARSSSALRELLLGNALHMLARALLSLGRPAEARSAAEALPRGSFSSFDRHGILAECLLAAGDAEGAKPILREWYAQWPLDIAVWRKAYQGMLRIGDLEGLAMLDREMPLVLGLFLSPAEAEDALRRVKTP